MNSKSKYSISSIYSKYFDIVDSFFGSIKHYLGDESDSHIDLGIQIGSYPLISDLILDSVDDLGEEIEKFWEQNAKHLFDFVKDQETLKCVYSGDISPVILEDFVRKTGLYVDSIIIPDPIWNLSVFHKEIIEDGKYYLSKLVRHVFNVWKLRDLVLANSEENILFILPISLKLLNYKDRESLSNKGCQQFAEYINKITSQTFANATESMEFFEKLDTSERVLEEMKEPTLLPSVFQELESLDRFLSDFAAVEKYSLFAGRSIGFNFGLYIQSQFLRVQEHKYFCDILRAEPIYDYGLPWFFFNYEVGGLGMDASIINALQREKFE
jgi:hypothetical protein